MSGSSPPAVSVVLAAHDAAIFLRPALASLLRQTVEDLELIVVDDGSVDGTPEILASITDPRLVVLRNDERLGLASSLNRGLERATGRYVARLDADDVAVPTRLERQLRALRGRPELAVVGGGVLELDEHGGPGRLHLMPRGPTAIRWHALFSSPFYHPTVLLDRAVLERHGLRYDPEFAESEDYDLWARLLAVADGANVPSPLVLYRVHPGQATRRRRDVQRSFQREVALRGMAALEPPLDDESMELAWLLGSGAGIPPGRREDAAEALVTLLRAFERRYGRDTSVRRAAARVLARAGALQAALRLDAVLPVRAAARRMGRRGRTAAARRDASRWLASLGTVEAGTTAPVRVAAVFPEPTPYRGPFLDRIAARPEVDLTVVHAAATVAGRTWTVTPRHDEVMLRGIRVPGLRRVLRHDYPVTPGVWRALDTAAPDVVVAEGWSTFAAQAAVLWARRRRVPYVLLVSSHDHDPRRAWRRVVKGAVVPRLVRGAAGVLVAGSLVRESMLRRGASSDRIRTFAYTIDVRGFGERADRLAGRRPELRRTLGLEDGDVAVLSVGRLVPEKNFRSLVRAVAVVDDSRLVLVLVGDGPERSPLSRLAADLGVRALFLGDVPWERIVEMYAAADLFALLSVHEPWGVVVNEAAACGLPLLLSDAVGAAHDLLRDGENGARVPAGDVYAAARALRLLAADPQLRLAQGQRSREIVAGWGYEPSVASFVEAVRAAAGRKSLW